MILKNDIWSEDENEDVLQLLMDCKQARLIKEYYLRTTDSSCKRTVKDILDILNITIEGINLY